MRGVCLLLLFAYSISAFAQGSEERKRKSERRIFLWDVTISMVGATNESPDRVPATPRKNPDFDYKGWMYDAGRDIFDATRDELCNMIDQVTTTSTELWVVPYTTDIYPAMKVPTSTPSDKDALKKMIREWNGLKSGGTYTGKCLDKVMNAHFDKTKKNTVILLTDGRPSTKEDETLLMNLVDGWDWNKEDSRYENNRLVYVMLNKESELPIESKPQKGVTTKESGTPVSETVNFALANTRVKVYVNEYVSGGQLASGGVFEIGTDLLDGNGVSKAKCGFVCAENDYIEVSDAPICPNEKGMFVVPFTFKGSDRDYYRDVLTNGKGTVVMKCVLLTDDKNISLVDTDEVSVELIVKDEPRAIISLSKK